MISMYFIITVKIKKKKSVNGEEIEVDGEINLIISENGILYPVEIKTIANPKADMTSVFDVLDKVKDSQRGMGTIICMYDKKLYLRGILFYYPYIIYKINCN